MLSALLKNIDQQSRYRIFLGFAALFAFLASPVVGPSYMWWSIDTLEFDQVFIGLLGQVGGLVAIIVLWIASDFIAKSPIKKILLLLIICQALFQLPNIMLYYGVHDYLGISAKAFALLDSSLDTPLSVRRQLG